MFKKMVFFETDFINIQCSLLIIELIWNSISKVDFPVSPCCYFTSFENITARAKSPLHLDRRFCGNIYIYIYPLWPCQATNIFILFYNIWKYEKNENFEILNFLAESCLGKPKKLKDGRQNQIRVRKSSFDRSEISKIVIYNLINLKF